MSGAGRTGTFLAAEHWPNCRPDLVTLAKGIAAGYTPMGAVLAPAEMVETIAESGGFLHGHTYASHPLSCAIGHAVVSEMPAQDLMANAQWMGAVLRARPRSAHGDVLDPRRCPGHGTPLGDRDRRRSDGKSGEWLMITLPLIVTAVRGEEIVALSAESLQAYEAGLRCAGAIRRLSPSDALSGGCRPRLVHRAPLLDGREPRRRLARQREPENRTLRRAVEKSDVAAMRPHQLSCDG